MSSANFTNMWLHADHLTRTGPLLRNFPGWPGEGRLDASMTKYRNAKYRIARYRTQDIERQNIEVAEYRNRKISLGQNIESA